MKRYSADWAWTAGSKCCDPEKSKAVQTPNHGTKKHHCTKQRYAPQETNKKNTKKTRHLLRTVKFVVRRFDLFSSFAFVGAYHGLVHIGDIGLCFCIWFSVEAMSSERVHGDP